MAPMDRYGARIPGRYRPVGDRTRRRRCGIFGWTAIGGRSLEATGTDLAVDSHQVELATLRLRVWLAHSLVLLLLIAVPAGAQPAPKGSPAPPPVTAAE